MSGYQDQLTVTTDSDSEEFFIKVEGEGDLEGIMLCVSGDSPQEAVEEALKLLKDYSLAIDQCSRKLKEQGPSIFNTSD